MKAQILAVVIGGLLGSGIMACAQPAPDGAAQRDDDQTSTHATRGKKKTATTAPTEDRAEQREEEAAPGLSPTPPSPPTLPTSDAGAPGADGGATPPPLPPPSTLTCSRISSCADARTLDPVRGDGFGATITTTGAGSELLAVRVRDAFSGADSLGLTAQVISPNQADYEVYIYDTDCRYLVDYGLVDYRGVAIAAAEWPNNYLQDDSRTMLIEVRYVGGRCEAEQPWRLDVEGGVFY